MIPKLNYYPYYVLMLFKKAVFRKPPEISSLRLFENIECSICFQRKDLVTP